MKSLAFIIPTYKRPETLARALSSIGALLGEPKCEVIVLDDDPDCSGIEVCRKFAGVKYLAKRGDRRGLSESRNLGVALADSEYVCFLDDDDFFTVDGAQALFSALENNAPFVFGNYNHVSTAETHQMSLSGVTNELQLIANQIPVGSYAIKKSLSLGGFDTTLKSHEDWDFLLRNVDMDEALFLDRTIVNIDKTDETDGSMQNRRRKHFWLDYVGIYGRFPAPDLAEPRTMMLKKFGMAFPEEALRFGVQI